MIDQEKLKAMIVQEFNEHARSVSDNMRQNFTLQRKDTDAMVKRLGNNIQDALNKIKDDVEVDYRDMVRQIEEKNDRNIKLVVDDVNSFGNKWDSELQKFQVMINKQVEGQESQAKKEFAALLDQSMQTIEDTLNNNIILQIRQLDRGLKEVQGLEEKQERVEKFHKTSFDQLKDNINEQVRMLEALQEQTAQS